jgi:hypothetical protein
MAGSTQVIDRQAAGLLLHPNPYSLPEGALLEADNVVVDRPGVVSKSRGFNRYGDALSNAPSAIGEFNNTIMVLDGTTLKYDSDGAGTWSSLSGTYSAPNSTNKMRFLGKLLSLYFTTSTGVFRLDSTAGTPSRTGIPQGLDIDPSFTGTGVGWFTPNTQVAYKIVFLRKDSNNQELIGAASFREVVTNSYTAVTWTNSGTTVTVTHTAHGYSTGDTIQQTDLSDADAAVSGTITVSDANTYTYTSTGTAGGSGTANHARTEDVSLTSTVPDFMVAGDSYEIYRTEMSADDTTDPGARFLKVNRVELASADITAGTITFTDDFSEAFLGEDLYSNPTQEGSGQANYRPPFATDIAHYRGHTFYANTRQPHRLEIQLIDASSISNGATITIGARTYTASTTAENIGTQTFLLEQGQTTEAENIEITIKSLIRVANRDTGNSIFYLYYISGADDPPGQFLIERRDLTDTALAVTVDVAGTGATFSPVLPTSGTTVQTEAAANANGLYRSKFEQPDAVPLLNLDVVGQNRDAILRIIELRDSLMIFTEHGIFRLSGEDELSFDISKLETDIELLAPESPAILNDSVFCFTNQGVASVNENGAEIKSFYGIEKELLKIINFSNYATLTWGVSYDEDRKYFLFSQGESGDTTPVHAWVWNDFTKTWTRRLKKAACGIVPKSTGTLYLGHAVDTYVLSERKSFGTTNADFSDEDIDVTIDSVSTTTNSDGDTVSSITLTYTYTGETLGASWLLTQGSTFSRVVSVTDNGSNSYTLEMQTYEATFAAGAATVSIPIASRIRWKPEVVENPGAKKQFPYITISLEEDIAREINIGFLSDVVPVETFVNAIEFAPSLGWGSIAWGPPQWGSGGVEKATPMRVPVPQTYQRCQGLSVIMTHDMARTSFAVVNLSYVVRMLSSRTTHDP